MQTNSDKGVPERRSSFGNEKAPGRGAFRSPVEALQVPPPPQSLHGGGAGGT
jgi:hypothetical protein